VGENPEAARRAGIPAKKVQILAMILAGGIAGFVALSEVLGSAGQYRIGFSPDYGFIGIAVALLAGNNPLGIIAAAFLMGALHKGASDLDLETNTITRDFSRIIQALIILGVAAQGYWEWHKKKKGKK
jgi:simple sugar transport system permease protein